MVSSAAESVARSNKKRKILNKRSTDPSSKSRGKQPSCLTSNNS